MQVVSMGMAGDRGLWPAPVGIVIARDRARVEDAAVEQGAAADPVGAVSGASESAAGIFRRAQDRRRLRREAALVARGRQRDDPPRWRDDRRCGRLWRGRAYLPGLHADSALRR